MSHDRLKFVKAHSFRNVDITTCAKGEVVSVLIEVANVDGMTPATIPPVEIRLFPSEIDRLIESLRAAQRALHVDDSTVRNLPESFDATPPSGRPHMAHCMRDPSTVGACAGEGQCSCECFACVDPR